MNLARVFFIIGLGWTTRGAGATTDLYALPLRTIDGDQTTLDAYRGKALLIVNTASKCGYTDQYKGLEQVYRDYKDRGLVVLGFPSNDFWHQEPGTDQEIRNFCKTRYAVSFPMFAKGPVKGDQKQPLYQELTARAPETGEVKWNFEKFVVAPGGRVTARFRSGVKPESPDVKKAVEAALPKP